MLTVKNATQSLEGAGEDTPAGCDEANMSICVLYRHFLITHHLLREPQRHTNTILLSHSTLAENDTFWHFHDLDLMTKDNTLIH